MPFSTRRRRAAAIAAILILLPAAGRAAIVNSLRAFAEAGPGWSGSLDASYETRSGNTDKTEANLSGSLQWRGGRNVLRLLGEAERTKTSGVETDKSVMGHLRHNYRLGDRWATVGFVQLQEEPFQRLRLRTLLGVGVRYEALRRERLRLSLGATHMWERERLAGEHGHRNATRASLFASLLTKPGENVHVDVSAFYQPLWSDFGDWRLLVQAELGVALASNLQFFTRWELAHDERPPVDVAPSDSKTVTGIRLQF